MPDVLGYRAKIGVLVPSTNTIVEPELHAMVNAGVRGVSIHTGRIPVFNQDLQGPAEEEAFREHVLASLADAVRALMTAAPDYLVMGLSAPTFWGGREGARRFTEQLAELARVPVTTGAEALERALEVLGARRVAVLSPYKAANEGQVRRFLDECGYETVAMHSLLSPTALAIADVGSAEVRAAAQALNGARPDVLVQSGTNLAMAQLADELESELGKPVLAVNTATLWDALRRQGFTDQVKGFGCLLREH
jgi:maleate isomerase